MATARTYLPIVETACDVVSQLDVLVSFATVAALSPESYVRPSLSPLTSRTRANTTASSDGEKDSRIDDAMDEEKDGSGSTARQQTDRKIILRKARHPCVELMDGIDFIGNDYTLEESSSNFQIITGPNMVGANFTKTAVFHHI